MHVNTDAIDNSAGVDTSDHEVNIKILLGDVVRRGEMTLEERNALLASMTDEVAEQVLRDNYEQNVLLGNARAQRALDGPGPHPDHALARGPRASSTGAWSSSPPTPSSRSATTRDAG